MCSARDLAIRAAARVNRPYSPAGAGAHFMIKCYKEMTQAKSRAAKKSCKFLPPTHTTRADTSHFYRASAYCC